MRTALIAVLFCLLLLPTAYADWQLMDTPMTTRIWSVAAPSAQVIYACTVDGGVWKSSDGGSTWAQSEQFNNQDFRGIDFNDEMHGTVASYFGNIYATSDGGTTWDTILSGWIINHNDVFAQPGNETVFVAGKNTINQPLVTYTSNNWTTDDAWNFYIMIDNVGNEGQIVGFVSTESGVLLAACRTWTGDGAIVRSTDNGASWQTTYSGTAAVMEVDALGGTAFAVDLSGRVLRSTNDGETWEQVHAGGPQLTDVAIVSGTDAWAVGGSGTILRSTDGGSSWITQPSPVGEDLESIDVTPGGFAVATGQNGTVLVNNPGPPAPVSLTLTPTVDFIPETGGTVFYDVSLVSTLPITVPGVTFWTTVDAPNGSSYGPLVQQGFTLTPMMNVTVHNASQNVPGFAPDGVYTFNGYVGFFPNSALDDSFEFVKGAEGTDSVSDDPVENWNATLPLEEVR